MGPFGGNKNFIRLKDTALFMYSVLTSDLLIFNLEVFLFDFYNTSLVAMPEWGVGVR